MIKYNGMEAKESTGAPRQLPAGPYVAKVLKSRIEGDAPDQQLAVMVDIAEGPFEGFYTKKYNAAKERGSNYEVKYKGILRMRVPNPDNPNAMYPESDTRRFNDMIYRFQQSNPGVQLYSEDGFDESRLVGLTVGISVQEDEYNGSAFTKIARFEVADDVRKGLVKVMAPKDRSGSGNPTTAAPAPKKDQKSGMTVVNTEKLPWREDDERPW